MKSDPDRYRVNCRKRKKKKRIKSIDIYSRWDEESSERTNERTSRESCLFRILFYVGSCKLSMKRGFCSRSTVVPVPNQSRHQGESLIVDAFNYIQTLTVFFFRSLFPFSFYFLFCLYLYLCLCLSFSTLTNLCVSPITILTPTMTTARWLTLTLHTFRKSICHSIASANRI